MHVHILSDPVLFVNTVSWETLGLISEESLVYSNERCFAAAQQ
jgi:hypothetical protein